MATVTSQNESTAGRDPTRPPPPMVLRGVPYRTYARLSAEPGNRGLRMAYHDGVLAIMSPDDAHEDLAERLGMIVRAVTCELRLPCKGSGSTTFRRGGESPFSGGGKEPDRSYYLANFDRIKGKLRIDLDAGDPPPDLWIEVDHRGSSRGKLPLYARLGVPEVWQARVRSGVLRFLRLSEGRYEPIPRSVALPALTPELVVEALRLGDDLDESAWDARLRAWVREKLAPPAP